MVHIGAFHIIHYVSYIIDGPSFAGYGPTRHALLNHVTMVQDTPVVIEPSILKSEPLPPARYTLHPTPSTPTL